MIIYPEIKTKTEFELKLLHRKIGTIIIQEPTDSDLQEGDFMTRVWFVDEDKAWWLLSESLGKK